MHRLTSIVLLALVPAACGSDGPETVDVSRARVRILAGNNQTAQVTSTAPSSSLAPASVQAQVSADEVFPEVLRVVVEEPGGSSSIVGPSFAVVPAGTAVHWAAREEGCGAPVGGTTLTDAAGESVNRWRRGTKARACTMDVCRVLPDGEIACDASFTAVQTPGSLHYLPGGFRPPTAYQDGRGGAALVAGDTVDMTAWLEHGATCSDGVPCRFGADVHGNEISRDTIIARHPPSFAFATSEHGGADYNPETLPRTQPSWTLVVPSDTTAWVMYAWVGPTRSPISVRITSPPTDP